MWSQSSFEIDIDDDAVQPTMPLRFSKDIKVGKTE